MAIPRSKKSTLRTIINVVHATLVFLIILLPFATLAYLLFCSICILVLPFTLYYFSSNFGMLPRDRTSMQVYIDAVQQNHPFMYVAHKYNNRRKKPPQIKFYPHKRFVSFSASYKYTEYVFSHLSGVLSELENNGWKREVVYNFFQLLVEQSGVIPGPDFHAITKKICSHKMHYTLESALFGRPLNVLLDKLLPSDGKIQMWEGTGKEEIAVFEDLQWMVKQGAVIRPQNVKVLLAIESLDKIVGGGMWKFASSPDDVRGRQWQTVVKPREIAD